MKNFIQTGDSITVTALTNVVSGQGVLIGSLFGVAATTAATGDDVALSCRGVFALPAANALAVGDPVEWDAANAQVAALNAGNRSAWWSAPLAPSPSPCGSSEENPHGQRDPEPERGGKADAESD